MSRKNSLHLLSTAFQMLVFVVLFSFLGNWIDEKVTSIEMPIFTILGFFIGFGISFYYLLKSINKKNNS